MLRGSDRAIFDEYLGPLYDDDQTTDRTSLRISMSWRYLLSSKVDIALV